MYVRRLLYNEYSKYIISVILGLGLPHYLEKYAMIEIV